MSTYGYIRHDEMSGYAIAHHGIKGQKWGIRRFQNPDGSLTPEGRARYGISDKEYSIAKKLYRGKGKYSIPLYTNLKSGSYEKAKKSVEAILKYDAMRSEAENGKNIGYFNAGRVGLNSVINTIRHYKDKNGNIALSYAEVPRIGEVYVKGSGNLDDLDLNRLFKKIPKGLNKESNKITESPYKVKGASQSIKNFSVSKAASDCGKMIDKFNKELGNTGSKTYTGEDIQMFLEKNLKEFNDLWDDGSNTIFDLEEKIAKELDKKGYRFID